MLTKLALVAAGGAVGAALRFLVVSWTTRGLPGFPWGTVIVNVAGSVAMGVLAVVLLERVGHFARWAPLLLTGVLGGFTTFSAFSLDAVYLMERGRWAAAAGYVGGSVLFSIGGLAVGFWLARRVLA
ncbi:MAG: CrcB family protein [Pseudomonadota bacterium]